VVALPALFSLYMLALLACIGMAVGLGVGAVVTHLFRTDLRMLWADALLGGAGIWGGFFVALVVPWRGEYVSDGWTIRNHFPFPWSVAFATALLLPAWFESMRARRIRRR
jgi:hypothetical protein